MGLRMNDEIDRQDLNRKLVKMTSDEFARGVNAGFRRSYQELMNRDVLFLLLVLLWVIGMSIYRYFFAAS
jgi:phage shock protein PspC (stress-responsive transcriptional regulator)